MRHWPSDRLVKKDVDGWICDKCADRERLVPIISDCVVYHVGECAWCGRDVPVSNSDGWTKKSNELIVKLNSGVEKREAESYNAGLERAAEIADLVVKDSDIRGASDVTTAGRISAARKIAKQIRQEKRPIREAE